MQRLIDGMLYDTTKAKEVYKHKYVEKVVSDKTGHTWKECVEEILYKGKNGHYFTVDILDGCEQRLVAETKLEAMEWFVSRNLALAKKHFGDDIALA